MASSSTTVTTIVSRTTASPSASSTSSDQSNKCESSQRNFSGLSGPVCDISTFNDRIPLPDLTSCCATPSDIRPCGNNTQVCEVKFQNSNITLTQEQTSDCVKNLYKAVNSDFALSVSCSEYKNGERVNGASGLMGNGIYEGAMGVWALVMVLGWSLNLI